MWHCLYTDIYKEWIILINMNFPLSHSQAFSVCHMIKFQDVSDNSEFPFRFVSWDYEHELSDVLDHFMPENNRNVEAETSYNKNVNIFLSRLFLTFKLILLFRTQNKGIIKSSLWFVISNLHCYFYSYVIKLLSQND